jgi:1-acyl-sn-glycerol-3-phosphate acyltransferase
MPENAVISDPSSVISGRVRDYDHAKHESIRRVLRWAITHIGFRVLAKMEFDQIEGLENLPKTGAAILMINHIAFIDPIVVLGNLPRNIVPMAKAEAYWIPIWGIFVWLWHVIPVRRGEADREALMNALAVLKAGEIVLVAPQGTRQPSLQSAKEGIAYLAHKSGAPIIPVAVEGTRGFPTFNLKRWKEPGARFKLGKPFRFKPITGRLPREALKEMTDEAMYRLAAMLPEERRGIYADLSKATSDYIENGE